jgi:hypothetical protein
MLKKNLEEMDINSKLVLKTVPFDRYKFKLYDPSSVAHNYAKGKSVLHDPFFLMKIKVKN